MEYQGSLDAPPIVLTRRRDLTQRSVILLALFVVAGATAGVIGWHLPPDPPNSRSSLVWYLRYLGPGMAVFSAWMCLMGLANLVDPPTLRLSPEGICYKGRFGVRSWRWQDISRMWLYQPRANSSAFFSDLKPSANYVLFSYAPGRRRSPFDINARLAGADGGVPGGWPVESQAYLSLLTQASERWIGQAAAPSMGDPDAADRSADRIEMVQSRVIPAIVFAVMAAITIGLTINQGFDDVALFGIGAISAISFPIVHGAVWPDRLIIDPSGVTLVQYGLSRRMGWTYGNFRLDRSGRGLPRIAFDAMKPGPWPAFVSWLARFTGIGSLPAGWTIPTERVVDRLNAAQQRWSGTVASEPVVH